MTPDEEKLRNAWLAEMWAPCPEWRQTKDERLDAAARNDLMRERRNGALTCWNGRVKAGRNGAINTAPALDPPFRRDRKEGPW